MSRPLRAAVVAAVLLAGCAGADSEPEGGDLVARGDELYHGKGTCQTCHGADLQGTTMGPPFLDAIYAPDHHPDAAFFAAVENGVRPHHWDFGPMPRIEGLDDDDVSAIVAYVRDQQRRAGVVNRSS